jgi:hypothetical protein
MERSTNRVTPSVLFMMQYEIRYKSHNDVADLEEHVL